MASISLPVSLSHDALSELVDIAKNAAVAAGTLIWQSRDTSLTVDLKITGASLASQVVTEIDRQSEACILELLAPSVETFDLGLLCEESHDTGSRLIKEYFWCVDPLDGTLAYTESKTGYAVSIALVSKSGEPVIGVVYQPDTQIVYSAVKGRGVFKNGNPLKPQQSIQKNTFVLPCDRSFVQHEQYSILIQRIEAWCRQQGFSGLDVIHDCGAVLSACKVLESQAGCYFKRPKPQQGGGSIWDFAATACLFKEFGASASDFNGYPLDLNAAESSFMNQKGIFYCLEKSLMKSIMGVFSCD